MRSAPGSAGRRGLASWWLPAIQVGVLIALLVHGHGDGGQAGRPSLFQLITAGLGFLMVSTGVAAPRRSCVIWALGATSFVAAISWLVNLPSADAVDYALRSTGFSGSYLKISVYALFSIGACWVGVWAGGIIGRSRPWVVALLWTVVAAATVNAIATVVAWVLQTGAVLGRYNFEPPIIGSYGISASVGSLGVVLALPLWLAYEQRKTARLILVGAIGLCLFSTLIIMSRQVLLTIVVSIGIYMVLLNFRAGFSVRRMFGGAVLLCCAVGFVLAKFGYSETGQLYRQIFDESDIGISGRVNVLEGSKEIFRKNPVLGVGYGFWYAHNPITFGYLGDEVVEVTSPHNGIAQIGSELGTAGLVGLLAISAAIVYVTATSFRNARTPLEIGISAALISFLAPAILSQVVANSTFLPPPTETSSLQYAFVMWVFVGVAATMNPSQDALGGSQVDRQKRLVRR